jgi:hypothetical protein
MKKTIICFDIDNTICKTIKNRYNQAKPFKNKIKKINYLYDNGYYIKIFTARYMGRCKENIKCAKKKGFLKTKKQLEQWKVKYHKLIMGKPSFDILIDDKSLNFKKNWLFEIDKKIK